MTVLKLFKCSWGTALKTGELVKMFRHVCPFALHMSAWGGWTLEQNPSIPVRIEVFYVPLCPLQVLPLWFRASGEGSKSTRLWAEECCPALGDLPPSCSQTAPLGQHQPGPFKAPIQDVEETPTRGFTEKKQGHVIYVTLDLGDLVEFQFIEICTHSNKQIWN